MNYMVKTEYYRDEPIVEMFFFISFTLLAHLYSYLLLVGRGMQRRLKWVALIWKAKNLKFDISSRIQFQWGY